MAHPLGSSLDSGSQGMKSVDKLQWCQCWFLHFHLLIPPADTAPALWAPFFQLSFFLFGLSAELPTRLKQGLRWYYLRAYDAAGQKDNFKVLHQDLCPARCQAQPQIVRLWVIHKFSKRFKEQSLLKKPGSFVTVLCRSLYLWLVKKQKQDTGWWILSLKLCLWSLLL